LRDPTPSARHARAPQGKTCSSFCSSWLHPIWKLEPPANPGRFTKPAAMLVGKLRDEQGGKFTRSQTFRHGKVYTYYISKTGSQQQTLRIRADLLEKRITDHLRTEMARDNWVMRYVETITDQPELIAKILELSTVNVSNDQLLAGVETITAGKSATLMGFRMDWLLQATRSGIETLPPYSLKSEVNLAFRSRHRPILTCAFKMETDGDWVTQGRRWFTMLANGVHKTQTELARSEGISQSTVSRAIDAALAAR
ncbi:MAG: hypothetical protein WBA44_02155, partial [Mesorhizobium sp.]